MKDIEYYLKKMALNLDSEQTDQLYKYMEMVIKKNEVMNLTSITDPEEFALKHIADSLLPLTVLDEFRNIYEDSSSDTVKNEKTVSMIDVGTGAGFPGIPLKIACPDIELTLLDSLRKRVDFLQDVTDALGLKNVTCIHSRAEDGARKDGLRDGFDFAVSRAVAAMNVLIEYDLPYVKEGGLFVAYKSGDISKELADSKRAVKLLGGKMERTVDSVLPDSDIRRSFVIIKKEKKTPKAYPRKAGSARKSPL